MQKRGTDEDARRWIVIDKDSGQRIDGVVFADDETGEYHMFLRGSDGAVVRDRIGNAVIVRHHGNIELQQIRAC